MTCPPVAVRRRPRLLRPKRPPELRSAASAAALDREAPARDRGRVGRSPRRLLLLRRFRSVLHADGCRDHPRGPSARLDRDHAGARHRHADRGLLPVRADAVRGVPRLRPAAAGGPGAPDRPAEARCWRARRRPVALARRSCSARSRSASVCSASRRGWCRGPCCASSIWFTLVLIPLAAADRDPGPLPALPLRPSVTWAHRLYIAIDTLLLLLLWPRSSTRAAERERAAQRPDRAAGAWRARPGAGRDRSAPPAADAALSAPPRRAGAGCAPHPRRR